jgi:hypothetical protein
MSAAEPFDRSLPSPIAAVLELRASSRDSVVVSYDLTPVQQRMRVITALEERIVEVLDGDDPPDLVVLSGSSGGGKSMTIDALDTLAADRFGNVVKDATHAEAPDREQQDDLTDFFAPFADGAPAYTGRPRLIAMNTGMVIRFFDQLRPGHIFTSLEAALRHQLELPPGRGDADSVPGTVLVINLDQRPTAGGDGLLFTRMLERLDPDLEGGIMEGSPRCKTCTVREWCFVRTNAAIVSSEPARGALDRAAAQLALDRARYLQPRALWDLAASVVTGDEPFGDGDPCDRIVQIQAVGDRALVWRRLACNGPFLDQTSRNGSLLHRVDPAYAVSGDAHRIIGRAGINPAEDAETLLSLLGGPRHEAVQTAASALASSGTGREAIRPRGLVRAAALAGKVPFAEVDAEFASALAEYALMPDAEGDSLTALASETLVPALARAFGADIGGENYFRTEAYDPRRRYAVLVNVEVEPPRLQLPPDPRKEANPHGSEIVGYTPLAISFQLQGVRLEIDLPLYRLLRETLAGTLASTADLERFYWLRRAADALGQAAAEDHGLPLLITDAVTGERFRLAQARDLLGRQVLTVRPVFA